MGRQVGLLWLCSLLRAHLPWLLLPLLLLQAGAGTHLAAGVRAAAVRTAWAAAAAAAQGRHHPPPVSEAMGARRSVLLLQLRNAIPGSPGESLRYHMHTKNFTHAPSAATVTVQFPFPCQPLACP